MFRLEIEAELLLQHSCRWPLCHGQYSCDRARHSAMEKISTSTVIEGVQSRRDSFIVILTEVKVARARICDRRQGKVWSKIERASSSGSRAMAVVDRTERAEAVINGARGNVSASTINSACPFAAQEVASSTRRCCKAATAVTEPRVRANGLPQGMLHNMYTYLHAKVGVHLYGYWAPSRKVSRY